MVIVISGLYNAPLSIGEEGKEEMERSQPEASSSEEILITSPYSGHEHHLDLTSVDESSKQLALALQTLKPTTNEYPAQHYAGSFNWQEIVDQLSPSFAGNPPLPPLLTFDRRILLHRILFHTSPERRHRPPALP